MRPLILLPMLFACAPAMARDCKLDGVDINPDNASYYEGKSGRIKCYDEAGELISEEEVRDGEMFGYERRKDLWGNWSERTTNANHNTHGVAKEFWPDGTLKSEARYQDGDVVGVARRFHKNGKLARVSHSDGAALEYDAAGNLESLRCAKISLLPEDKLPCGFGDRSAKLQLYRGGRPVEDRITRNGELLYSGRLDGREEVTESSALENGAEVRRAFHPNGKPASELRVVDGFHVQEREWYMNGQLKTHTTREPKERGARSETTTWRDDGSKQSVAVFVGRARVSHTLFDNVGRLFQIEDHAPDGHLERRRTYAPGGALKSDESYYPDGSRR